MTTHERIRDEVEKTLECLDRMPRLGGNPFLYTRIEARLHEAPAHETVTVGHRVVGILKPALLLILVAVNIVTLVRNLSGSAGSASSHSNLVHTFVQEYSLGPDTRAQFFTTENK